jgi:hypothetical protein
MVLLAGCHAGPKPHRNPETMPRITGSDTAKNRDIRGSGGTHHAVYSRSKILIYIGYADIIRQ